MSDNKDSWKFVHITDIHIGSSDSYRFAPVCNEQWETAAEQIKAINPELILVGGDITRDGDTDPEQFANSIKHLNSLGIPWHLIPGNMDTGNKIADRPGARMPERNDLELNITEENLQVFKDQAAPFPWTFTHRGIRFSGCYEIIKDTDLPSAAELDIFLTELSELPSADHHIMLNHYPLFVDDIDERHYDITKEDDYLAWYFGVDPEPRKNLLKAYHASSVTHVLSGHIHCRRPPFTIDGITYVKGASTAMKQFGDRWPDGDDTLGFQVFTVTPDGIEFEFHPLTRISTRTDGWGPGGHPQGAKRAARKS